ncbi:MAG TPA: hypothetical protein VE776_09290 [Actinomycetota bacterium]|jgi:hypothetical protein|nr:hypothetical protein [Actinomycetota bacterium]
MAVHLASASLPPNVHIVYEVLCSEGPLTGRQLELLLEKRGVVVPAGRLLELPSRFPGVFTIDQSRRLAVQAACDRCGAHACDACRRDVAARACSLCERTVCRDCRATEPGLEACCLDCAAPTRVPEADQRYGRAWALGGDRWLLVGERSAMLVGAAEGPRVVVRDDDLDDPVRRRLRALAAALRLPPEIGLRWRGPTPEPAARGPTTAWLETHVALAWHWLPAGGSEVDLDAADALPEAEGPPVAGEGEAGLTALLARLRAEAPPPSAGTLEVTPLLEVTHVTVIADGLERRRERHEPGGRIESVAVERAPFEPSEHPTHPPARPVARARLGPVTATLDAVHASYWVAADAPEGPRYWFAPGAPGITLASEVSWGSVVPLAGLAPGTQIRRPKTVRSPADEDFANPTGATLAERRVEASWRLLHGLEDDGVAGPGELVLVGYELLPVEEAAPAPSGLLETARRLDPRAGDEKVTLGLCLEVEERWEGRGSALRSYLVLPGSRPWPVLDDSGEPAADFGVDELGHLHRPLAEWVCPACQRARCPACGPDGQLDACGDCGQPACQACRLQPREHDEDQQCERCGTRSCSGCGRTLDAVPCRLCRRLVCRRCQDEGADGRCPTCMELRPASEAGPQALPVELAAAGLSVLASTEGDWTVAVLLGLHRRELAVLHSNQVVRWETAAPDAPVLLRARIGAARAAGADVELRQGGTVALPSPPDPHLLLDSARQDSLRWAVLDRHGHAVMGSDEPPEPTGTDLSTSVLARLVEEAGWGAVSIPEPAPADVADLLREIPSPQWSATPAGTLVLDPRRADELTWLDAGGLHHASADGRADVPWTPQTAPAWVEDDWFPVPEVVLGASLVGRGAVLARVGAHLALGLRDGEGTRWTTLRNRPAELAKLAIASALGEEGALYEIVALTDPDTVRGPVLVDASLQQRDSTPVTEEQPGAPRDDLLRVALRRFAATLQWTHPPEGGDPILTELASALLRRAAEHPSGLRRARVGIGLQLEESWLQRGSWIKLRYELPPGEHEGMVRCEASGALVTAVSRDREGHLVATTTTCRYCRTETCPLCIASTQPCAVCQILICARCSSSPEPDYVPRCPACVRLRRLGWMERRRFHRLLAPGGRVLAGQDALHGVTLLESGAGWQVLLEEPGQQLPSALIAAATPKARLIGRIADTA